MFIETMHASWLTYQLSVNYEIADTSWKTTSHDNGNFDRHDEKPKARFSVSYFPIWIQIKLDHSITLDAWRHQKPYSFIVQLIIYPVCTCPAWNQKQFLSVEPIQSAWICGYRQSIRRTKSQHSNVSRPVFQLCLPNTFKLVVSCRMKIADRRCFNYIWVFNNFIAY